jgi:histone H3/H4
MAKAKKKTKAKAKSKKKVTAADLVVKSKVKEMISKSKCQSSGDVFGALNDVVGWYVDQAVRRAKANKRKTVRGYDFFA